MSERGERGNYHRVFFEPLESRLLMAVASPDFAMFAGVTSYPAELGSGGMSPAEIRHAYGIDQVMFGSVVGDGSGQTIAIVDAYHAPNLVADLRAFDQRFGLPDPELVVIGEDGTTNLPGPDPMGPGNSWAIESTLDVQWAHAVAPGAKIVLVEASSSWDIDMMAAVNTARKYPGVSAVSMSWGGSEFSRQSAYNKYFKTPSHHGGVTFIASSGDSGAYVGPYTMGVSCPASSPYVLSVGGTTLRTDGAGDYLDESGWGSGESSYYYGGSGGGLSKYVHRPSFQSKTVPKGTSRRSVPDVAFVGDPNTGAAICDSWDSPSSPWLQIGGTSLGAPMWAGVIAIVNQGRALAGKKPLNGAKQTIPYIYKLPSGDFNDITTGNNGYPAQAGFDLVTGRGTPIVNLLAMDLAAAPTKAAKSAATTASSSVASAVRGAIFRQATAGPAAHLITPAMTITCDTTAASTATAECSQAMPEYPPAGHENILIATAEAQSHFWTIGTSLLEDSGKSLNSTCLRFSVQSL